MTHQILAELLVVLHLAFVVFVLAGGLLALRWRWIPLIHLPAALWGVFIELSGGLCPLTPLENALRRAAGESGYSGGFIEHYILPVLYPEWLSAPMQLVLAAVVIVVNGMVYALVLSRRRAGHRARRTPAD